MSLSGSSAPKKAVIHIVSDGSGATSEAVVDAAVVQFPGVDFELNRHPGIRTREQVLQVVAQAQRDHGIIVHTIVITGIRRLLLRECRQRVIDHVDLTGPLLGKVSQHVEMRPILRPGASRGLSDEYSGESKPFSSPFVTTTVRDSKRWVTPISCSSEFRARRRHL